MSVKTFIGKFQDYLFNLEPLYDRLKVESASKSDFYGAYQNTKDILNEFSTSIDFLEKEALDINKEMETIFKSMHNKLDKIEAFSSAIIGINSSGDDTKNLATINPYVLSDNPTWDTLQKCLVLPITKTYESIKPYTTVSRNGKGMSRFIIGDSYSTKYISVSKLTTTQLVSISFLNDSKEELEVQSIPSNINLYEVLISIPLTAKYITIEYYYDSSDELIIKPLTFKYQETEDIVLKEATYDYGDILVFNSNIDLPTGCYAELLLDMSFKDVNDREVNRIKTRLPINSDGLVVDKILTPDSNLIGFWEEGIYSEVSSKPSKDSYKVFREQQQKGVSLFTESALKFSIKNSKTIQIRANLRLTTLKNNTETPKVYSVIGMTKNA